MRLLSKIVFIVCLSLIGCKSNVDVTLPISKKSKVAISNIQVVDHQIIITGSNLNTVTNFQIKDGVVLTSTQIESKTSTKLVANSLSNVTLAAGKLLDFILSDATAASTFTVNFSLCNAVMGGAGFECFVGADEGDVLTYNGTSHKWEPRSLNIGGLQYKGTWDAGDVAGFPTGAAGGDYYIVSVAATVYNIGDWIVFNSTLGAFEHVRNSASRQEGDYSLTQLADVDLSNPVPTNGMVLKYNSATSTWIPGTVTTGGGGTVTAVSVTPPLAVSNGTTTPALSISQANTTTNGYLSSADWNTFNTKESALPAGGTTAQYLRGDKTLATLNTSVVPESGALYFTDSRVRSTPLTGVDVNLAGSITGTDTVLQALGKAQQQISTLSGGGSNYLIKNAPDTLSGAITLSGSIDATAVGDIKVGAPLGMTSAVNQSYVNTAVGNKLDKTSGGTVAGSVSLDTDLKLKGPSNANYVTVRAHATTSTYNFVLPTSGGTNGHVLSTDGSGNTSWVAMSGGGGVSSVNTQTGAVDLTTDNIPQGTTNLYYTNANALGTTITAPTLTNSSIATSDTIQVALGKLQAQLNNVVSKTLTGLTAGTNTVIAAGDTLLVALANLQGQITYQGTNKADKTNGAQAITAASVTATNMTASQYCIGVDCIGAWPSSAGDFKADGTVAMTGKFRALQGAFNNPSISFASSPTTGIYDAGGYLGFSSSGSLLGFWSQSALTMNGTYSGYLRNFGGTTSATPAYAFNGSTNTGMYFLNPNGIGFSNAGVETVRILSTGVGIGVTVPTAKLDVAGEIKFGNTASTCDATTEGQQRYNSATKVMEFCNGTAWSSFGGGGGSSGGITACPAGFTFIPPSNTYGTNAFCIDTVKKVPNPIGLGPAIALCSALSQGAEICKNRQLTTALEYLPANGLEKDASVWTGDFLIGDIKYVQDLTTATIMLATPMAGSRSIGLKGTYLGTFTQGGASTTPPNSAHDVYCCMQ